jgi:tRNA threonylcarbamoyladenosine biosynthesis protein TsaE
MDEFITHSEEETEELGRALANRLQPGDVVGLYGDLGAGKTCLVRGVAQGLGAHNPVASPTFTLVNEYAGRCPLFHFDLYRLNHAVELEDLGVEDYLYDQGICLLEWAEKAGSLLPAKHWKIIFHFLDEQSRRLQVIPPEEVGLK